MWQPKPVDEFVALKAFPIYPIQHGKIRGSKPFIHNHLQTTQFSDFQ
jgi:hypothetical protein